MGFDILMDNVKLNIYIFRDNEFWGICIVVGGFFNGSCGVFKG